MALRQVWVIQCKSTGEFLTQNNFWTKSLKRAGRLFDKNEAIGTAEYSISDYDFEIHTFFEGTPE